MSREQDTKTKERTMAQTNERTMNFQTTGDANVINHVLVDLYGYEESKPLRTVVASSKRYGTLLALASHCGLYPDERLERLTRAVAKTVQNPKTRAEF